MGLDFLTGLLAAVGGGAQGAAPGVGQFGAQLSHESDVAAAERQRQDEDARQEEARALDLIGSGRFRVRGATPDAPPDPIAGMAAQSPVLSALRAVAPTAPVDGAPAAPGAPAAAPASADASPVAAALAAAGHRLRLADLEQIPQAEQDQHALALEAQQEEQRAKIAQKYGPWQPHTEGEYIEAHTRIAANAPGATEARQALADQRTDRLRTDEVDRAIAAAVARLGGGDPSQVSMDDVIAAASRTLASNPRTAGAWKNGTIGATDLYAGAQRFLHGQRAPSKSDTDAQLAAQLTGDTTAAAAPSRGFKKGAPKKQPVSDADRKMAAKSPKFAAWLRANNYDY